MGSADAGTFESLWRLWREHREAKAPPPGAVMEISHDADGVHGSACPDKLRRSPEEWVEFHGWTPGEVLDQAVRRWPGHCFEVLVPANCPTPVVTSRTAGDSVITTRRDGSNPIPGPDAKQWIYPVEDGYVISLCGAWLPGAYADLDAAREAFSYDDETLLLARGDGSIPITVQRLRSTPRRVEEPS